jgi:hypothetical protein
MQCARQRRRAVAGAVVVLLALGACGSDGTATVDTAAEEPEPPSGETPAPPTPDEGSAEQSALPDGLDGILEIDGEEFLLKLSDTGTCDADFFGTFRAFLGRVDESGERMTLSGDLRQGTTFILLYDESANEGTSTINVLSEVEWMADPSRDERSGVDEVALDGNRAVGSATFVGPNGEGPVSGRFELVCPGG